MCNIAGYIGPERAAPILIDMIRKQEGLNGGFFTGIVTVAEDGLHYAKVMGDLSELLRQCAGEYAQRFEAAGVEPVLALPEGEWTVTANGRLLWRVLDNLLQNVTKYAQSGTRCYLELKKTPEGTELAVKNISRQALNIPAEELLERFVRGDAARSTEGSGLGLSIARSLTELMGGALELVLDGDLFKITLRFPE